ncbi:MAG: hypothetical protein H7A49_00825 [Akkermansiaceae bacterium]|nr:hypothetical protein [Akkermansiaceae bacterium]MCP5546039.1 hypothetical protein [Akkermansiaceae bacterium]
MVLVWLVTTATRLVLALQALNAIGGPFGSAFTEPARYFAYPSITDARTRLLLFGDESSTEEAAKWRPLWESEPSNKAYFANYVGAWNLSHGNVSDALLEQAATIDPGNGWYLALASGSRLDDTVLEKRKPSNAAAKAGERTEYKILNESEYAIALELFFRSAENPDFSDRSRDLYQERVAHLPHADDVASNLRNVAYAAGQKSSVAQMRRLVDMISHEANRSVLADDEDAFRRTVRAWRWFVERFNRSGSTLVDGLVLKVILSAPLRNFHDAATHFGMAEDAAFFDELHAEFEAERVARRESVNPDSERIHAKGSLITSLAAPMIGRQVKSPPLIDDADLKPGRLADHALAGRLLTGMTALLLVLVAATAVAVRYRHGAFSRKLSERMILLLHPGDWLVMGLLGVVLPLAWFLVVTRLSPLSFRDWNPKFAGGIPLLGQWGALAVLVFTASASAAGWRLDRRLRFLGPMPKSALFGFAAVVCAALAVPAFGAIPIDSDNGGRIALWVGAGLGGAVALWWLAGLFSIAIGYPGNGVLRRVAISRLLVPLWLAGALVFAGFSYQQSLEERHWVKRDTLMGFSPEAVGLSRYEGDVTEQLRKELGEVIARLPEM